MGCGGHLTKNPSRGPVFKVWHFVVSVTELFTAGIINTGFCDRIFEIKDHSFIDSTHTFCEKPCVSTGNPMLSAIWPLLSGNLV